MKDGVQDARTFLDRLVGKWDLTEQMGNAQLSGRAETKWMQKAVNITMHFYPPGAMLLPFGSRHRTYYTLAYNVEHDHYELDRTDDGNQTTVFVPLIGKRDENTITFRYSDDVKARLIYDDETDIWMLEEIGIDDSHILVMKRKEIEGPSQSL